MGEDMRSVRRFWAATAAVVALVAGALTTVAWPPEEAVAADLAERMGR